MLKVSIQARVRHRVARVLVALGRSGLGLLLSTSWAIAHGGGDHSKVDTTVVVEPASTSDTTETVRHFKAALDSLYTEIKKSYTTVQPMLEESCYDCHSDKTRYPWYYKLPIARQLIDTDIAEAREHLDMSEGFPFGGHAAQASHLQEIREEVEHGGMPPRTYRMMHWGRLIEDEQRDTLFMWIDSSLSAIAEIRMRYGMPEE